MKIFEERTRKETILKLRKCDLYGRESKSADWRNGIYEENQTVIKMQIIQQERNSCFPDGSGSGSEYDIDLCPTCFLEKLVPWLKSQGAKIEERKWES